MCINIGIFQCSKNIMKIRVSSQKKVPNSTDGIGARRWIVKTHASLYVNYLLVWTVRIPHCVIVRHLKLSPRAHLLLFGRFMGPLWFCQVAPHSFVLTTNPTESRNYYYLNGGAPITTSNWAFNRIDWKCLRLRVSVIMSLNKHGDSTQL